MAVSPPVQLPQKGPTPGLVSNPAPASGDLGRLPEDLRGAHLVGLDLRNAPLAGRDLSGADLSEANLSGADLRQACLAGATLARACLRGTELLAADLRGANLDEVDAPEAGFGKAHLAGASMFQANLTHANLQQADLENADLRAAKLTNARLRQSNLRGVDGSRADLQNADLLGITVDGARFAEANLRGATFRGIIGYQKASFLLADIRNVDFSGAYLLRRYIMDENYLHEFRSQGAVHRLLYWLWWASSDCGRNATRWAGLTLTVALAFGASYSFVGVDYGDHPTWLSPYYFSIVTLTTLGYGDVLPTSALGQIVVIAEVAIGYMMLGGLISLFANKMARRAE